MKRFRNLMNVVVAFMLVGAAMLVLAGQPAGAQNRPVIVLSPGHGWNNGSDVIDPGAVSGDLVEKDLTLDVAQHTQSFLSRCPVSTFLTRNSDDQEHTLKDVHTLVNEKNPSVGISIHVNSSSGMPSGTEGWYTVGGFDDKRSHALASILANSISKHLSIADKGTKPETSNRHGGLYIHYWKAPAALIEIAYLQGDAELLRDHRSEFGRSIAGGILAFLGIPLACADALIVEQPFPMVYFPGETKANRINLTNDGLETWNPPDYSLKIAGDTYGAHASYILSAETKIGAQATWDIQATAPSSPGVYRQIWQLHNRAGVVGGETTVYIIVVPEEARELKSQVERRLEELRQQGEREVDRVIGEIEIMVRDWVAAQVKRLVPCISGNASVFSFIFLLAIVLKSRTAR